MNKINNHLDLYASERFLKNYRAASLSLQRFAEGNIHDLVNRYRSDSRLISNLYDKLAHCKARILEGDLSGGCRFLFDYSENRITLLDMGDHDIVKRYNDSKYNVDMLQTIEAPSQFFPEQQSKFFIDYPDASVSVNYMEEVSAEWLYCLENEQKAALEELEYKFLYDTQDFSTFIVGGPGTGKTCILLAYQSFAMNSIIVWAFRSQPK